jgi:hypothetical protein
MHRTNVVLDLANLIHNPVRERCSESHDLDVFGEIISRCAFKNGSAPSMNIVSVTYDLIAGHDWTCPLSKLPPASL